MVLISSEIIITNFHNKNLSIKPMSSIWSHFIGWIAQEHVQKSGLSSLRVVLTKMLENSELFMINLTFFIFQPDTNGPCKMMWYWLGSDKWGVSWYFLTLRRSFHSILSNFENSLYRCQYIPEILIVPRNSEVFLLRVYDCNTVSTENISIE